MEQREVLTVHALSVLSCSQISSHRFPHVFLGSKDGAVVGVLTTHFCALGSIPEPGVTCELSMSLVLVLDPDRKWLNVALITSYLLLSDHGKTRCVQHRPELSWCR